MCTLFLWGGLMVMFPGIASDMRIIIFGVCRIHKTNIFIPLIGRNRNVEILSAFNMVAVYLGPLVFHYHASFGEYKRIHSFEKEF